MTWFDSGNSWIDQNPMNSDDGRLIRCRCGEGQEEACIHHLRRKEHPVIQVTCARADRGEWEMERLSRCGNTKFVVNGGTCSGQRCLSVWGREMRQQMQRSRKSDNWTRRLLGPDSWGSAQTKLEGGEKEHLVWRSRRREECVIWI